MEDKNSPRYKDAEAALERFITSKFPNDNDTFTVENREFLVRYSILKEDGSSNNILFQIGVGLREQNYFGKWPKVKEARDELQKIYSRYNNVRKRKNADDYPPAFRGEFYDCLNWWYKDGKRYCFYCGIDEETSEKVFATVNNGKKLPLLKTKKPAWKNGSLQIDKKDPHPNDENGTDEDNAGRGYNKDNCVFACVICNNAKSDLIEANDFKRFFGSKIKEYWDYVVKEMEKQE